MPNFDDGSTRNDYTKVLFYRPAAKNAALMAGI